MNLIKNIIKDRNSKQGFIKYNGKLQSYLIEKGELKTKDIIITENQTTINIKYPFLNLEISKVIHDFKNLLNPLAGLLQGDDFNADIKEICQYYHEDFNKVITDYEKVRDKFYNQEINIITFLDLYLQNFLVMDINSQIVNIGEISRKISNLHLYDYNFLVIVYQNADSQIEFEKKRLEELF